MNNANQSENKCLLCEESTQRDTNDHQYKATQSLTTQETDFSQIPQESVVFCPYCQTKYHLLCLAENAIDSLTLLIPNNVICVLCEQVFQWKEWICSSIVHNNNKSL